MELLRDIWAFFLDEANQKAVASILGVLGFLGALWLYFTGRLGALFKWIRGSEKGGTDGVNTLTADKAMDMLARREHEVTARLEGKHGEERAQLQSQLDELRRQQRDPDAALAEAKKTIADLEARLEHVGNDVGGDRLAEAREALKRLDYSKADEVFAEVEERRKLEVQEAARAAFGRGEIAEAEVRWGDAADHYARSARLDPSYDTLVRAGMFLRRAGRYSDAIWHGKELVDIAMSELGTDDPKTAVAMNNLAESYRAAARFAEAEPLYREALEITRNSLGEAHPDYAIRLNNLAVLLKTTGRSDEAEPFCREALEIDRKALGEAHPDYAIDLNNLAELLRDTNRFDEAEPLYREALEIDRKALGEAHPGYAVDLNNLAGLLRDTGRFDEAEPLNREALEITRTALGEAHPDYAQSLNNLALLLKDTGRHNEAEPLYREAVSVYETALGPEHPHTKTARANLERILAEHDAGE